MKFLWIFAAIVLLPLGCSSPMSVDTDRKVTALDPPSGNPVIPRHWMQAKSFTLSLIKSNPPLDGFSYSVSGLNPAILVDTSGTTAVQIHEMQATTGSFTTQSAHQSYLYSITMRIDTLTVGEDISLTGKPNTGFGAELVVMSYIKKADNCIPTTVSTDGQKIIMKLSNSTEDRLKGTITAQVSLEITDPSLFPESNGATYTGTLEIGY